MDIATGNNPPNVMQSFELSEIISYESTKSY